MKKILIALSSSFTSETFKENFLREGFQVGVVNNGKEALEVIKRDSPDLVLADVSLEEIDGFELIKKIKEDSRINRIPVIIYSRSGSSEHREKAMDYEARDFVVGHSESPRDVAFRIKNYLKEQKAYIIPLNPDIEGSNDIIKELNQKGEKGCPSCNNNLSLYLLRNPLMGESVFSVSLVCLKCNYRSKK